MPQSLCTNLPVQNPKPHSIAAREREQDTNNLTGTSHLSCYPPSLFPTFSLLWGVNDRAKSRINDPITARKAPCGGREEERGERERKGRVVGGGGDERRGWGEEGVGGRGM